MTHYPYIVRTKAICAYLKTTGIKFKLSSCCLHWSWGTSNQIVIQNRQSWVWVGEPFWLWKHWFTVASCITFQVAVVFLLFSSLNYKVQVKYYLQAPLLRRLVKEKQNCKAKKSFVIWLQKYFCRVVGFGIQLKH